MRSLSDRTVPLESQIAAQRVGNHPLCPADGSRPGSNGHTPLPGEFLVGHRLEELAYPETSRITSRSRGGQNVVGADRLVRISDRRLFPEKQRAVVGEVLQEPLRFRGLHFQV